MSFIEQFESKLPQQKLDIFRSLNDPFLIQTYLDSMPYMAEERDRSPLNVMLDNQSHCLDGGLFASLALFRLGFDPVMIDIVPSPGEDDDHVLALYKIDNRWGAVAKSNYVNLGFREPVYRTIRELVMTYFEHYFSIGQEKTLRGYTRPFNCSKYTKLDWAINEKDTNILFYKHFYGRKAVSVISTEMAARLHSVPERAYRAATLYTDLSWSFGNRPNH
jgi:hypothetical protein